jgi:hypothetical protein
VLPPPSGRRNNDPLDAESIRKKEWVKKWIFKVSGQSKPRIERIQANRKLKNITLRKPRCPNALER